MKVLKRSQVTQVEVKRLVYHDLELNDVKYQRIESNTSLVPYMDCDFPANKSKIEWRVYVGNRTIQKLSSKEVKKLRLNELFEKIELNEKNGNA